MLYSTAQHCYITPPIVFLARLNGILVGYGKLFLRSPEGAFLNEAAHIHVDVISDFWVFRPQPGAILRGVVVKKSPTHVGCFVHGCFNVSCYRPEDGGGGDWMGAGAQIDQVSSNGSWQSRACSKKKHLLVRSVSGGESVRAED